MDLFRNPIVNDTELEATVSSKMTFLTTAERIMFIAIFSVITAVALIGNVFAILATLCRNHRFVQKSSIISLALSDICMTIAYSTNNLETFSHPMINWTLGEFACSFIPLLQIFGLMVNLFSMVIIALDRYCNVVKVLAQRWNPKHGNCIFGYILIWMLCFGASYPIFQMFEIRRVRVYYPPNPRPQMKELCVSTVKEQLKVYYLSIEGLIFASLWSCFLMLNCSIARLIWTHRKPVTATTSFKDEGSFSNEASTAITHLQSSESKPTPQGKLSQYNKLQHNIYERRNVQVERKVRTFKIIVFCIVIFTICRLPFWIFNVLKLSRKLDKHHHWLITYWINALALLNCAINPFLYVFLHPTLAIICKLWSCLTNILRKVFCWYCSAPEFEELGKENPFSDIKFQIHSIYCGSKKHVELVGKQDGYIGDQPFGPYYDIQHL